MKWACFRRSKLANVGLDKSEESLKSKGPSIRFEKVFTFV